MKRNQRLHAFEPDARDLSHHDVYVSLFGLHQVRENINASPEEPISFKIKRGDARASDII